MLYLRSKLASEREKLLDSQVGSKPYAKGQISGKKYLIKKREEGE
jgi:hypothetical protein